MPCLIFNDEMNTNNVIKRLYVSPWCEIVEVESICLLEKSVELDANNSYPPSQWDYDDKGAHDGGSAIVGDKNAIAPAKPSTIWDD